MKFWMSGEIMADVGDAYRDARKDVEAHLNRRMSEIDYGAGLKELAFIAMILSADGPPYKEIQKYSKRDKTAEFRLRIDHGTFKRAASHGQRSLIVEAVARAIGLLSTLRIPGLDQERLQTDFRSAAREREWLV